MTITAILAALVADLAANDVPDPLAQPFTLANLWYDLCVLAGEEPPAAVLAHVEGDSATLVQLTPVTTAAPVEYTRVPFYAD